MSVRPQKVFPIWMICSLQVEVDYWGTTVWRLTQSKVKVKGPLKLANEAYSKAITSAICKGIWKPRRAGFSIFALVFMSCDLKLGPKNVVKVQNYLWSDLDEIWYVGKGWLYMHNDVKLDPIQGQGQEPFEVAESAISQVCLICHLKSDLGSDCWFSNYVRIS